MINPIVIKKVIIEKRLCYFIDNQFIHILFFLKEGFDL
jgi:hypothetical protein